MSNEPSRTLIICGKHPALGWLAVCVFLNAGSISVFLDLRFFAEINSVAPVLKKKKVEAVDSVIYFYLITNILILFSMMYILNCVYHG